MTLWKITARELARRPGRCLLTFLSVALAVAAVVAVSLATASTRSASRAMYEKITGRAALEVVAAGGETYDQRVVAMLEQTPGVAAAVSVLQQPTIMYAKGQRLRLLSLAIDPRCDATIRDYEVVEGHLLDDNAGTLLPAGLAQDLVSVWAIVWRF